MNYDGPEEEWGAASEDAETLFQMIDSDGDGVIDKQEFEDAMHRIGATELHTLRQSLARSELSAREVRTQESSLRGTKIIIVPSPAAKTLYAIWK